MDALRRLATPAGALAMIASCWLPWADVRCGSVHTTPTYWQLADYDHRLYALVGVAAITLGLGLTVWRTRHLKLAYAAVLSGLMAVFGWCFLWLKREELAALQAQTEGLGDDVSRMLADLTLRMGIGFKVYAAGSLLALIASSWFALAARRKAARPVAQDSSAS